jgi:hypothetical protein
MNRLLIAVVAALSLVGPAFARGVPPGTSAPAYGSHAFPDTPFEPAFFKLFGHKTSSPTKDAKDDVNTSLPTAKRS